jgi:hypothetical protein
VGSEVNRWVVPVWLGLLTLWAILYLLGWL